MKLLVVGGGGREHAIIKKLKENPSVETIYALPGNGGIAADAVCVPIGATDIPRIVEFAVQNGIDYAVVAPDDPLVLGAVDALTEKGIPCFGPSANAAIIEGSKVFSKNLMKKYGIPTARYEVFEELDAALKYLETAPIPTVIKADGLALGKGVIIAQTREEANRAVTDMMANGMFGASGSRVVIEEFLTGPEVSVLAFTDGKVVKPMVSSMDHKRIGDNDTGLNTGGMGTVAPNPYYTPEVARECMEKIFLPTIAAMNAEGRTFRGCLYFGLMLTPNGPKVIEYNCRFGDPETQVVHHQRDALRDGGQIRSQARLLRDPCLPGLSCFLQKGLPHHHDTRGCCPHVCCRGQAGGKWGAAHLWRPGHRHHRRGGYPGRSDPGGLSALRRRPV